MQNNDGNERSTASKVLFGTWLTNGLVISVAGAVALLVGISGNWVFELRNGTVLEPGAIMGIGVVVLFIGISLICVHFAKKKN